MTRRKLTQHEQSTQHLEDYSQLVKESGWLDTVVASCYTGRLSDERTSTSETMEHRINRVHADVKDIEKFYNINFSPTRIGKIVQYLREQLTDLENLDFYKLDQEDKIDYLLLRNWIKRNLRDFVSVTEEITEMHPLLSEWTFKLVHQCERRQRVESMDPEELANLISSAASDFKQMIKDVNEGKSKAKKIKRSMVLEAIKTLGELREHVAEMFNFYNSYDPLFSWWLASPYNEIEKQLEEYIDAIREHLLGIKSKTEDEPIVGDPIGRKRLLANLEAEFVPYNPEDLLKIGQAEYDAWMKEMHKASQDLGYSKDWHKALEHVKKMYVPPGDQPDLIRQLADEAVLYVRRQDLVTVPPICEQSWRTLMMSPERQKVSPFFLGGKDILVSYPTSAMPHEDKKMSMRGNSKPFSKATVFHELIPGHHLQYYHMARDRPYRSLLFTTPFWVEGWAMYWEYVLWDRGDFFVTPEDRIGTLFWRLHRCARIIFSLNFHLGNWKPQECIDFLVDKVGHERATAEGEVRRSFNGDYSPLYQCGYMLGALQLRELRRELVDEGKFGEKEFHDRVLRENQMPIEVLRALLVDRPLDPEYKSTWRFYHDHKD